MLKVQSVVSESAASTSRGSLFQMYSLRSPHHLLTWSLHLDRLTHATRTCSRVSVLFYRMSSLPLGSGLVLCTWNEMDLAVPGLESCLLTPHVPAHPTLLCYLGQ